jgi:ATP-dependent exoDNAse (exonuclease V) alpha subunit
VVAFAFIYNPAKDNGGNRNIVKREIPVVLVRMDDNIGYTAVPSMQNILPFTAQCDTTEKYDKNYHRWQLPLKAALATTTHKMQGSIAKGNCVTLPSKNKPWSRGLDYVANSRAKDLSKLFLLRPLTESHFTSHPKERMAIAREYEKLSAKFST